MIDPQRRRSQLSRPHVMDPIHPRTKEPLADTGFSFLHPGDVCSKVTGQRPPLLPRFFPRIHPRGAAETLGTARRRSPFTEALSSPPPPPRLNGSESRSSAAEVSLPDWKLHVSALILRSVPPPQLGSPIKRRDRQVLHTRRTAFPAL